MVPRRQVTGSNSGTTEISHRGFIKFTDRIALLVVNGNIRAPRSKLAFILGKVAEYLIKGISALTVAARAVHAEESDKTATTERMTRRENLRQFLLVTLWASSETTIRLLVI